MTAERQLTSTTTASSVTPTASVSVSIANQVMTEGRYTNILVENLSDHIVWLETLCGTPLRLWRHDGTDFRRVDFFPLDDCSGGSYPLNARAHATFPTSYFPEEFNPLPQGWYTVSVAHSDVDPSQSGVFSIAFSEAFAAQTLLVEGPVTMRVEPEEEKGVVSVTIRNDSIRAILVEAECGVPFPVLWRGDLARQTPSSFVALRAYPFRECDSANIGIAPGDTLTTLLNLKDVYEADYGRERSVYMLEARFMTLLNPATRGAVPQQLQRFFSPGFLGACCIDE